MRIGKTSSHVSRIESGKQNCSVPDIKALARALAVHVAQLFGEEETDSHLGSDLALAKQEAASIPPTPPCRSAET